MELCRWSSDCFKGISLQGPGADPGFSFNGGAKDYVCAPTSWARNPKSLTAGVQGPLKGPASSQGFLMLSRAIWALVLSIILIQKWEKKKNHSRSNFRGVRACCTGPPLNPPLGALLGSNHWSPQVYNHVNVALAWTSGRNIIWL